MTISKFLRTGNFWPPLFSDTEQTPSWGILLVLIIFLSPSKKPQILRLWASSSKVQRWESLGIPHPNCPTRIWQHCFFLWSCLQKRTLSIIYKFLPCIRCPCQCLCFNNIPMSSLISRFHSFIQKQVLNEALLCDRFLLLSFLKLFFLYAWFPYLRI